MPDKQTEALKLALEAAYLAGFKDSAEGYNGEYPFRDHGATPTEDRHWVDRRDAYIREALAEQSAPVAEPHKQQEPVSVARVDDLERGGRVRALAMNLSLDAPLYTSPPASKPLTDEEIDKLPWEPHEGNPMTFAEGLRYFARAIEAAHGIKGGA